MKRATGASSSSTTSGSTARPGSGRVCDHSSAELQQVNAAACYKGKYAPEHIPSFDEYCEWASGESVGHNIEIKTDKIYYHDIERKPWATI